MIDELELYRPSLEPEDGWSMVDGRLVQWEGWRVRYSRPAPSARNPARRTRHTFLLVDAELSLELLAAAIANHVERDRPGPVRLREGEGG